MSNTDTANRFYDACESGLGWETCRAYCHEDAGFACQAGALAGVETVAAYAEWMKGMQTPMPDATYELKALAEDAERGCVLAFGVFTGTHTGPGGPAEPTGKATATEYVYVMRFEAGKIKQLTKVWNDGFALAQLGWV